jgi:hypothetical protein
MTGDEVEQRNIALMGATLGKQGAASVLERISGAVRDERQAHRTVESTSTDVLSNAP